MLVLRTALVVFCVGSSCFAATLAIGPMYIADSANNLFTVDVVTGHADRIGGLRAQFADIAFSPSGRLYGITTTYLYEIDPSDAWSTLIGPHGYGGAGSPYGLDSLTFTADGALYAAGNDILVRIDPATGAGTTVGALSGYRSAGDLAVDTSGRLLLSTDAGVLVEARPDGSGATAVGSLPYNDIWALAGAADGTLYGVRSTNDIVAVDSHTGHATAVSALHSDSLIGRAWGGGFPDQFAMPEPSTLAIGLAGALLLAVWHRRPAGGNLRQSHRNFSEPAHCSWPKATHDGSRIPAQRRPRR